MGFDRSLVLIKSTVQLRDWFINSSRRVPDQRMESVTAIEASKRFVPYQKSDSPPWMMPSKKEETQRMAEARPGLEGVY